MAWIEKGQPTPFDQQPISGLFLIDGDLLNQKRPAPWAKGHALPTIVFPSGARCDLARHPDPTNATVDLFDALALPLFDTPENAFLEAQAFSQQHWYEVTRPDPQTLTVIGDNNEQIIIQYDTERRQMSDVIYQRNERAYAYPISTLFDDDARSRLPHYSAEKPPTLDDLAHIRFTTFDGWSWYAAAYDGNDTFYGLVVEDVVRLTTFSLADIATLYDSIGHKVSRDYLFEPTSLRNLKSEISHPFAEEQNGSDATLPFPSVTREQLQQTLFKPEEVDELTDDDLQTIAINMRNHYMNDLFWDELQFHAEQLLDVKRHVADSKNEDQGRTSDTTG